MRAQLDSEDVEKIATRVAELLRDDLRQHAPADRWLDARQAAAHLGITPNALHKLTSARLLPFSQDRPGGRCYFKLSELDEWRESQSRGPAR